jgi:galactoside O-acetyltransferase
MNLFNSGFYTEKDLVDVGFKNIGSNILIDKNCTIIGLHNISIGSNVRIDAYTTITASEGGSLIIGSNIHIAGYCLLAASGGIIMEDFSAISHGTKIYSASDDYSGGYLTNAVIPDKYKNVKRGLVTLKKHSLIGSSSVLLPGVVVGEGTTVGAMSLVSKNLDDWSVYAGIPAKKIKDRPRDLLRLEQEYVRESGV